MMAKTRNEFTAHKKNKKLATKLTTYILLGVSLVFLLLIIAIANSTKQDLIAREMDKLTLLAKQNATIASAFMEPIVNKQDVIKATIKGMKDFDENERLSYLQDVLTDIKAEETQVLSMFFVGEPNQLLEGYPNGFSIFATDLGTQTEAQRFTFVDEKIYNSVKQGTSLLIADPFKKTIDGKEYMVISTLQPVFDDAGILLGVLGSNIDTAMLNGAPYENGGYETFSNQIICGHQTFIIHSTDHEKVGTSVLESSNSTNTQMILDSAKDAAPLTFLDVSESGSKNYRAFVPFYVGTSTTSWLSGTSVTKGEFDQTILAQILSIVLIGVVGLVILTVFVYSLIKRALRPIGVIEQAALEMSKGNLAVQIDCESDDEIGSLAESLRTSMSTIHTYILDIDRAMASMANGNFDVEPGQPFIGDFQHIEHSITKFIKNMSAMLTQIDAAAEEVSSGSDQVSMSAQAISQGATEQASSVEELSAILTEVASQVKNNAKNSTKAEGLALGATAAIESSNVQMQNLMLAMNDINQKSAEISKIVKTIEDIAFQTNILALNAAVEAARAGGAGKGFAVVADEVRNLASKSAEAAKSTTELISGTITAVSRGSQIANEAAADLAGIVSSAEATTKVISEVTKASAEQAIAVEQISATVDEIAVVVQNNSAASEESAAVSEELLSQATLLKAHVAKFKIKIF